MRARLLNSLDSQMREVYEKSASFTCDQVAAIRTVTSLKRELALQKEFAEDLKAPLFKVFRWTMASAAVDPFVWELMLILVVWSWSKFGLFRQLVIILVRV